MALAFREEWPCLVVVPSTLRDTWADKAHEWLGLVDDQMLVVYSEADIVKVRLLAQRLDVYRADKA